jgi:tetratricopeptide (TPR) repeat protein
MEFSPSNDIVKLCLQGMGMEDKGELQQANKLFLEAWNKATYDFEKFLAAYYLARHQNNLSDQLKWLEIALELALKMNDKAVKSAFPLLYLSIGKCYEDLKDLDQANKFYQLASSFDHKPSDKGPFYHGTKADLKVGDLLLAGGNSNYQAEVKMNHIYFTSLANGAGLAAAMAKGEGSERVYIVEPTGDFEDDPNLTNKKFPGNQTCSYRSNAPLKIVGELTDWVEQTPEELQKFRERLANSKGKIIN